MTAESLDLWLVLREGITSSEVAYIATTEADALAFTEAYVPDGDGYHRWAVRHVRTGRHVDLQPHGDPWCPACQATTPRVSFDPADPRHHRGRFSLPSRPAVTAELVEQVFCTPLGSEDL